jgi:hypothetical protein
MSVSVLGSDDPVRLPSSSYPYPGKGWRRLVIPEDDPNRPILENSGGQGDKLYGMTWPEDIGDPNVFVKAVSGTEPYVFAWIYDLPKGITPPTRFGCIMCGTIVGMNLVSVDGSSASYISDYIVVTKESERVGWYLDKWGNKVISLYLPSGHISPLPPDPNVPNIINNYLKTTCVRNGSLDVVTGNPSADLNSDCVVDMRDFAMAAEWHMKQ